MHLSLKTNIIVRSITLLLMALIYSFLYARITIIGATHL